MFVNPRTFFIAAAMVLLAGTAVKADERYKPIRDQVVAKECGACHMAFQPQMLPKNSWRKIMEGLPSHFGEDASLNTETARHIKTYLLANAAGSSWLGGKFMRGLSETSAPLRITETPYWIREHKEEVPQRAWKEPKVKSKANCLACHKRANSGDYDDD
ncbi:MAG: cytochrome C [Rhodospirillales bacterium]|nr:cytochrome C [Rhodospirillales bacterium]